MLLKKWGSSCLCAWYQDFVNSGQVQDTVRVFLKMELHHAPIPPIAPVVSKPQMLSHMHGIARHDISHAPGHNCINLGVLDDVCSKGRCQRAQHILLVLHQMQHFSSSQFHSSQPDDFTSNMRVMIHDRDETVLERHC